MMQQSTELRSWRELDALEAGKWWTGSDPIPEAALQWLSEDFPGIAPESIYLGRWDSAVDFAYDYKRRDFARRFPSQPWRGWQWITESLDVDWHGVAHYVVGQFTAFRPVPWGNGYAPSCDRLDVPVFAAMASTGTPEFWDGIIPGGAR